MTDRKAIKRAINDEGIYFFGGYYLPEDIPTVQALSAKTDETVARIKERVNGGGKEATGQAAQISMAGNEGG